MTVSRGTSNTNARGSVKDRAARRAWLLKTYRADMDLIDRHSIWDAVTLAIPVSQGVSVPLMDLAPSYTWTNRRPACRCYRCGELLDEATLTVDRIIPGCKGGRYVHENIRPACGRCNSETGAVLANRTKTRKSS